MKKIAMCFVLVLASFIANAQDGIIMEMKMTNSLGLNGMMKVYHSAIGSRTKMKMNMPPGVPMGNMNIDMLTLKAEPNKSYMINDERKSFTINESKAKKETSTKRTFRVEKLGTETVNGYKCTHAKVYSDNKEIAEMWVSKDVIADYDLYSKIMTASKQDQYNMYENQNAFKDADCEGFPVKTISGANTEAATTIELVKVQKSTIEKSLFEIPKDYKQGNALNTMMGIDLDMNKLLDMTPEQREQFQKMMIEKMGGQTR